MLHIPRPNLVRFNTLSFFWIRGGSWNHNFSLTFSWQQLSFSTNFDVKFRFEGTSIDGFAKKKSAGLICNSWTSTGLHRTLAVLLFSVKSTHITGQSSTRGLCVSPKQFQITTSSFCTISFLFTASATPSISSWLCSVKRPPANSSPSLYLVTQT